MTDSPNKATSEPPGAERERELLAMATFSCPFCGSEKGRPCQRVGSRLFGTLWQHRDLIAPHKPRLDLLDETDQARLGSFS